MGRPGPRRGWAGRVPQATARAGGPGDERGGMAGVRRSRLRTTWPAKTNWRQRGQAAELVASPSVGGGRMKRFFGGLMLLMGASLACWIAFAWQSGEATNRGALVGGLGFCIGLLVVGARWVRATEPSN